MEDSIVDNVDLKTGSLIIDDGDGQREIPLDVRGLKHELTNQRKVSKERKLAVQALEAQVAELSTRSASYDAIVAELEQAKQLAAKWQEYTAAEEARVAEANATRLAALPDSAKEALAGIADQAMLTKLLDAIASATPAPQTPDTKEDTAIPLGGIATKRTPNGTTLTAEERAFRDSQPTLRVQSDSFVREMYKKLKKK